jgi:hypothetical protein
MQWKRRKENGGFGDDGKNSNANGGRMVENKMDNYQFISW